VEAEVEVAGMPVTLMDTAGIRDSADEVEQIGVARSVEAARRADVVAMVVDASQGWTEFEQQVFHQLLGSEGEGARPAILVINKIDLASADQVSVPDEAMGRFRATVHACAQRGEGLAELASAVADTVMDGEASMEGNQWAGTQRQVEALQLASRALRNLQETMAMNLPYDLWTIDLREAAYALGSVTGEEVTEDVLGSIFSRFCIGK